MNQWKITILVVVFLLAGLYVVGYQAEDSYVKVEKPENVAVTLTPRAEMLLAEKRARGEIIDSIAFEEIPSRTSNIWRQEVIARGQKGYDMNQAVYNSATSAFVFLDEIGNGIFSLFKLEALRYELGRYFETSFRSSDTMMKNAEAPVNNLEDLYSFLDFTKDGMLGVPKSFLADVHLSFGFVSDLLLDLDWLEF
jgi:hypothetical protein